MKRWLSIGFICTYLGALGWGIVSHAVSFFSGIHPLMYFIVWDMFCGWTAYDSRAHVIAEGESQRYYELVPAPWGELHPWGKLGRQHYDALNNHTGRMGLNVLKHTTHEPITRLFVIEEAWHKKYNLPDAVWQLRYDEPKRPHRYYRVRTVMLPDGTITEATTTWQNRQAGMMLADNPRLQSQASKARSLFVLDAEKPGRDMSINHGYGVGAPLGN
jgi:hypothetical protein